MKQIRCSPEQRQAAVEQMGPPHNQPIKALAKATGVTEVTLCTWRREAIEAGQLIRRDPRQSERWSSQEKFRIVLESAPIRPMRKISEERTTIVTEGACCPNRLPGGERPARKVSVRQPHS